MKKKGENNYLKEYREYQDHQYDPGYYVDGRIPPYLTAPGKPRWLGLTFILSGLLMLFVLLIPIYFFVEEIKTKSEVFDNKILFLTIMLFLLFYIALAMFFVIVGVRYFRRK